MDCRSRSACGFARPIRRAPLPAGIRKEENRRKLSPLTNSAASAPFLDSTRPWSRAAPGVSSALPVEKECLRRAENAGVLTVEFEDFLALLPSRRDQGRDRAQRARGGMHWLRGFRESRRRRRAPLHLNIRRQFRRSLQRLLIRHLFQFDVATREESQRPSDRNSYRHPQPPWPWPHPAAAPCGIGGPKPEHRGNRPPRECERRSE